MVIIWSGHLHNTGHRFPPVLPASIPKTCTQTEVDLLEDQSNPDLKMPGDGESMPFLQQLVQWSVTIVVKNVCLISSMKFSSCNFQAYFMFLGLPLTEVFSFSSRLLLP